MVRNLFDLLIHTRRHLRRADGRPPERTKFTASVSRLLAPTIPAQRVARSRSAPTPCPRRQPNWSDGSFFEGVMTAGCPTDAADNAVQSNVVPVGYTQAAQTFPVTGTAYRLTNPNSGKVLDAVNCGTANGTAVQLWSSLGNTCQEWDVTPAGSHYTIANVNSGMTLDVANCGTSNGTAVRQWAQLDNVCQQWDIAP
ncbi:RICIN domain-containing protein [Streptomyces sp. NPDC001796]|uniref:RICIN domain-containing protein n=1 Tax=Streptomyces sp. NPDC001796 TaxID=3364609 RepID=UPI0036B1FD9D